MDEIALTAGWTYFIGTELGRPFKIGSTTKPDNRLAALQAGNPDKLVFLAAFETTTASTSECRFHDLFREHRMQGEWFAWTDAAGDLIAKVRRGCAYTLRRNGATGAVRIGDTYHRFGQRWTPHLSAVNPRLPAISAVVTPLEGAFRSRGCVAGVAVGEL